MPAIQRLEPCALCPTRMARPGTPWCHPCEAELTQQISERSR